MVLPPPNLLLISGANGLDSDQGIQRTNHGRFLLDEAIACLQQFLQTLNKTGHRSAVNNIVVE
jgi:hypothetical protein